MILLEKETLHGTTEVFLLRHIEHIVPWNVRTCKGGINGGYVVSCKKNWPLFGYVLCTLNLEFSEQISSCNAFQAVLDRIQSLEFVTRPIPIIPVNTMMTSLRETFRVQARWSFHDLFVTVTSKNEAIARFLALLELIKCGEVQVEDGPTIQLVAAGSRN